MGTVSTNQAHAGELKGEDHAEFVRLLRIEAMADVTPDVKVKSAFTSPLNTVDDLRAAIFAPKQ